MAPTPMAACYQVSKIIACGTLAVRFHPLSHLACGSGQVQAAMQCVAAAMHSFVC